MDIIIAVIGFIAVLLLCIMIVWGIPLFVTLTLAKWLSTGKKKDDNYII